MVSLPSTVGPSISVAGDPLQEQEVVEEEIPIIIGEILIEEEPLQEIQDIKEEQEVMDLMNMTQKME